MEPPHGDARCDVPRERSPAGVCQQKRGEPLTYEHLVATLIEPATRREVAEELRGALPDSCEALLDGLRHGPPSVRRWCAVVLITHPMTSESNRHFYRRPRIATRRCARRPFTPCPALAASPT